MVGNKVLDQVTLRNIAAIFVSFLSAIVPLIWAFWASEGEMPLYVTAQDVYQLPSGRFYAVSHVARSYNDSLQYCASRGMTMASIHSQRDADSLEFLLSRTRSETLYDAGTGEERSGRFNAYFLGARSILTPEAEFAGWEWQDGTPWDFQHRMFQKGVQENALGKDVHLLAVAGKGCGIQLNCCCCPVQSCRDSQAFACVGGTTPEDTCGLLEATTQIMLTL